ncbi:fasciclin domain-containing protein [Salinibacter altiplanensis]|uniref:fasciclin domain-containing protein n=1 Tax=Salinibacter altiplanensis TaxID=1803181 RepID=UPI001F42E2AF|nr:fasciclin domain-containing protein [Salinibacter altiplanensis]
MPRWSRRRILLEGVLVVALAIGLSACGPDAPRTSERPSSRSSRSLVADSTTVPRMLATDDRFSALRAALDSTGLDSVLATRGPYTVFAPPNHAFAERPSGTIETMLSQDRGRLRTLLARHIVERRVSVDGPSESRPVITMGGDTLSLHAAPSGVSVDSAHILDGDIEAGNGLLHVVDAVLQTDNSQE